MKRSQGREVHGAVRSSRETEQLTVCIVLVCLKGVSGIFIFFPFPPKSLLFAYGCECTCFQWCPTLSFCAHHFTECCL